MNSDNNEDDDIFADIESDIDRIDKNFQNDRLHLLTSTFGSKSVEEINNSLYYLPPSSTPIVIPNLSRVRIDDNDDDNDNENEKN
jgi:hypothetical protein